MLCLRKDGDSTFHILMNTATATKILLQDIQAGSGNNLRFVKFLSFLVGDAEEVFQVAVVKALETEIENIVIRDFFFMKTHTMEGFFFPRVNELQPFRKLVKFRFAQESFVSEHMCHHFSKRFSRDMKSIDTVVIRECFDKFAVLHNRSQGIGPNAAGTQ